MIIFAERELSIEDFCVTACSDPVVAQGFKLSIEDFCVIAYSGLVAVEGFKSSTEYCASLRILSVCGETPSKPPKNILKNNNFQ